MADLEELGYKLDVLIALTRIGVRDNLIRERRHIEEDPVSTSILRHTDRWVSAGDLKVKVQKQTNQSEPTIKRRLAELVSRGVLVRQGAGRTVSYRSSGLLDL